MFLILGRIIYYYPSMLLKPMILFIDGGFDLKLSH